MNDGTQSLAPSEKERNHASRYAKLGAPKQRARFTFTRIADLHTFAPLQPQNVRIMFVNLGGIVQCSFRMFAIFTRISSISAPILIGMSRNFVDLRKIIRYLQKTAKTYEILTNLGHNFCEAKINQ